MKILNPKKKRKAADSTHKIMREIEPFLPKRVRVFREKQSEWRLRETPCPEKDRNVKALLAEL
jgi:hypothetical protein